MERGTVLGSFRVLEEIGSGGMGDVYRAEHVALGQKVAIKVLNRAASSNPEIVQRFFNEAKAAAQLNHRNIVKAFDFGETADGRYWMALEYLDGGPLSQLIRSYAPMELSQIVQLIVQACNALQEAHAHGIVHRDIKPDNLFLTQSGKERPGTMDRDLKVLDFGVSKMRAEVGGIQTKSSYVMGTPAYMSPEQLRESRDVDGRADVYSLGVVIYEMVTGVRPWGDETSIAGVVLQQRESQAILDPRHAPLPEGARRPDIAAAFAQVVIKALHPDRTQRFQNMGELARALALAVPATVWNEDGMGILRKFAEELAEIPVDEATAGLQSPSAAPTLLAGPVTPLARPTVVAGPARAPGVRTVPLPAEAPPTTLAGSASQLVGGPSAGRSTRRWWIGGAVGVASVGFILVGLVVTRGNEGAPRSTAAALPDAGQVEPPRAMSALAIVTEPEDAAVFVDGAPKGTGTLNVAVPVGAEIVVRAERVGYVPATQTIRIGAEPAAVRLQLVALVVDAGVLVPVPAAAEPAPSRERDRDRRRTPREGGRRPSAVGSGSGAGSGSGEGSAKRPRPFNPDDVPD